MKVKWLSILTFILYLIQVLALYIMSSFLTFINMAHDPSSADILILVAFILLSITLIIINIVIAFLGLKRSNSSETKNPLGRIMGFKLLLTPFFIGHAYWFLVALGGHIKSIFISFMLCDSLYFCGLCLCCLVGLFIVFDCRNNQNEKKGRSYKWEMRST